MANHIRIRGHAKPDAIHNSSKAQVWPRHYVDISLHSWRDPFELAFPEIANCPPGAGVNEREHLLSDVSISAL